MKSRLATLALLVVGMLVSTTGVSSAVSGPSGSGSAAVAQYPELNPQSPTPLQPPASGTLPGTQESPGAGEAPSAPGGSAPESAGGTAPETAESPAQAAPVAQVQRQVEAGATSGGEDSLPFTGFAAVPVLLAGVVLVLAGLTLRRRSASRV